jgi:uncharacterized damage-inducible protein DinB
MNDHSNTISDSEVARASQPIFQHLLNTYASETNKTVSVWKDFSIDEMAFRPHERSSTVEVIMKHQLLSERRFFGEFLGLPEPPASEILPNEQTPAAYVMRLLQLARPRLSFMAEKDEGWWLEQRPFFDVTRERIWIFWRRVLHTAHHRTQLAVYLRFLGKPVPSIYGPTADVSWAGADPTSSVQAASRK